MHFLPPIFVILEFTTNSPTITASLTGGTLCGLHMLHGLVDNYCTPHL